MPKLRIHHRTTYKYREQVALAPHRLMLRPRESRELQLITHDLSFSPDADVAWSTDVFGNAIATATFNAQSDTMFVDSIATVDLTAVEWPVFDIAASAINYPFNHRRLLEPIGNIPPAEAEERYYAMLDEAAMAA